MKTMRNLLAKLQGITPDPYRTIRFRRDLVPHSPPSIPTGYDTSWQTRRLENYSSNPLLRLPNELLLEIMECLAPRELYLVRQVSYLFAALFRYAAFSEYHQKNTAEIDPATAEPSVHRLLRAYRKLRGKTAPVPHFIPEVEFNLDALRAEERDSLRYVLQRRTFCARCLAGGSQERQANTGIYPRGHITCSACEYTHHPSWFSPAHRQRRDRICIGWEGSMRICPHHSLPWSRARLWIDAGRVTGERRCFFRCRQCADAFGRHGRAPAAMYDRRWPGSGELMLGWCAPVYTLAKGEVLTKDVLRRSVERLGRRHPGLLCAHVAFDVEQLMTVFYWHACVCFRQPSAMAAGYRNSDERAGFRCDCCCAALNSRTERVGRFPVSPGYTAVSRHVKVCRQCLYHYKWTSDGRRIYLVGSLYQVGEADYTSRRVSSRWMGMLDPSTYQQTEEWRHVKWCPDRTCANSTNRSNW